MKTSQQVVPPDAGRVEAGLVGDPSAALVLVFGPRGQLAAPGLPELLRARFPGAIVAGCSTAGEVAREGALDGSLVVTTFSFDKTVVRSALVPLAPGQHREAGRRLADELEAPDLRYLLVLSEGLQVVAQDLVDGLHDGLRPEVVVSGGLAGDGPDFARTLLLSGGVTRDGHVVGVGFYGRDLRARCASASGWRPFGRERLVTRSHGNVVHELDGARALDVYSRYLGDEARHLPSSGLVFPVMVRTGAGEEGLIRSLSGIDRDAGSISFFGDVPQGSRLRLMNAADLDLQQGAAQAGRRALFEDGTSPDAALIFSCAGRKAVMGPASDLEIAAVVAQLPGATTVTGFYTYGEIGYAEATGLCEHHNQTLTVTLLAE